MGEEVEGGKKGIKEVEKKRGEVEEVNEFVEEGCGFLGGKGGK